jgi:predicted metal-binding membrane protein
VGGEAGVPTEPAAPEATSPALPRQVVAGPAEPPPAQVSRRDIALILALATAAGAGLWWWGASPAAHWLDHGDPALPALAGSTAAWLLMTVATMLPTALPVLAAFDRVTAARPHRARLRSAVITGFLAVWALAGLLAALLMAAGHRLATAQSIVDGRGLAAGVLLLAGAYQLCGLAGRCLRACRTPAGFLRQHWTGGPDVLRQSLAVGVAYGRSCLGCCAALLAVMLLVGMGNLGWMYLLALVGAVQKGAPGGERLARLVGLALLTAGGALVAGHVA